MPGLDQLYEMLAAVPNQLTPSYRRGGNPMESTAAEAMDQPMPPHLDPGPVEDQLGRPYQGPHDPLVMQQAIAILQGIQQLDPAERERMLMMLLGRGPERSGPMAGTENPTLVDDVLSKVMAQ